MQGYECLTKEQMMAIIAQVDFCYLGFVDCNQPYIYPMYFAADEEKETLVFMYER
ncbi:MAG: hypothetical protein PUC65_06845 [Clostridiales bacterium]|nr:hypothetical protein [Clostridiales bacterium]